ncbi:hypothetical protein AB6A40_002700 [Gnathostoma spinigerum]|uniref:Uncharacterized protein n=1 Tax=Gnathostoma spinigerum TaxID=75299 RepID=A0ABD6E9W7_9BILA
MVAEQVWIPIQPITPYYGRNPKIFQELTAEFMIWPNNKFFWNCAILRGIANITKYSDVNIIFAAFPSSICTEYSCNI